MGRWSKTNVLLLRCRYACRKCSTYYYYITRKYTYEYIESRRALIQGEITLSRVSDGRHTDATLEVSQTSCTTNEKKEPRNFSTRSPECARNIFETREIFHSPPRSRIFFLAAATAAANPDPDTTTATPATATDALLRFVSFRFASVRFLACRRRRDVRRTRMPYDWLPVRKHPIICAAPLHQPNSNYIGVCYSSPYEYLPT